MKQLLLVGAGGFGKEIAWVVQALSEWNVIGFADDGRPAGGTFAGFPLLGSVEHVLSTQAPAWFHCSIGRNDVRERMFQQFLARGWNAATLVDPSSEVAPDAALSEGCYIAPGAIVGPCSRIGRGAIINFHVSVAHDSQVGDFVHACPGARISGNCQIGARALLGSNCVIHPGAKVGIGSTVGAASFALTNVPDGRTVIGVPARSVSS
jgi:sugar O-acyltransferase (sialic acid O-acetyltransferase NeuD family)